jgi:threonine/homoserine/homoserine lactone efflux protein
MRSFWEFLAIVIVVTVTPGPATLERISGAVMVGFGVKLAAEIR